MDQGWAEIPWMGRLQWNKEFTCCARGHYQQQNKDELHTLQLKDAQSQVGALLWIALCTRPDLGPWESPQPWCRTVRVRL